jgi:hypothetical protein
MLNKSLKEEQTMRVDERLATVVRVIVEQYQGDVKAFIDSTRRRAEMNRRAEAALGLRNKGRLQHV